MKNLWATIFFFIGFANFLVAQNHFLYIQSENKEPFTVNVNDKNYTSTNSGYVIIPKLTSGSYDLSVKFSKQEQPISKFNVVIDRKDVGYNLKSANSTTAIVDMQTFVAQTSGEKPTYVSNSQNENATVKTTASATPEENALTAKNVKKGVSKIFEIQGSVAVSLRYVDVQESKTDTIDIVIPVTKYIPTKEDIAKAIKANKAKALAVPQRVESGLELLAVHQQGYNKNCVNLASGEDFYKLRKKMSSETNIDKMINEAKKAAKNKCFTTIQVKNLSALFLTDEGKYKFFNSMYPLIYDFIQFPTLEKEITDPGYSDKFRAILPK